MKNKRYEGRLLDAIPRAKDKTLFGWVSSPDFVGADGKSIACHFDEADIESGRELIRTVDLYGGWNGEHSDTCPSRGVRCEHGELCGGYPKLFVSFVPEKILHKVVSPMWKTEIRAITKNGDPQLDEFDLPMFEQVPMLDEHGQKQREWKETGAVVEKWIGQQLIFSR